MPDSDCSRYRIVYIIRDVGWDATMVVPKLTELDIENLSRMDKIKQKRHFLINAIYLAAVYVGESYITEFIIDASLGIVIPSSRRLAVPRIPPVSDKILGTLDSRIEFIIDYMRRLCMSEEDAVSLLPKKLGSDQLVASGARGWQEIWGPVVWNWLHVVAIEIELYHPDRQREFLIFIQLLIGCGICRHAYTKSLPKLMAMLDNENDGLCRALLKKHSETKNIGFILIRRYETAFFLIYNCVKN